MSDYNDLNRLIKRSATEAVEAGKPVNVVFGKVTSASPLKILVDQKMTLGEAQLVLTRNVTEHQIQMTVSHYTEYESDHTHGYFDSDTGMGASGSSDRVSEPTSHRHAYSGKKAFTVHNGLTVGEEVLLVRMQGGQKYIVLDRLG